MSHSSARTTSLVLCFLVCACPVVFGQSLTFTTFAGPPEVPGIADAVGSSARFNNPQGLTVDSGGNVYIADSSNHTIRKITPSGAVTTLAGLAQTSGAVDGVGGAARFNHPTSVVADPSGNIYVADSGNNTIRKITAAGTVTTLAGLAGQAGTTDAAGSAARFSQPSGVAIDGGGTIYVADTSNGKIRKVTSVGVVTTLASFSSFYGAAPVALAVDGSGSVYVAFESADINFSPTIGKVTSAGVVSTFATGLRSPKGVATDSSGNVYVAETYNYVIVKINPAGVATTLAGLALTPGSADGPAGSARFNQARGVATDSGGVVYVADTGNQTIRRITAAGDTTTLAGLSRFAGSVDGVGPAARFKGPQGVSTDSSGNVYVADSSNHTIRKITLAGVVSTFAGVAGSPGSADGTGTAAQFYTPFGIVVDKSSGTLFVADMDNSTIRKITSLGVVSTLAGFPGVTGSADGTGSGARFKHPSGVAVDGSGNVYVADQENYTIRMITPAGTVTTVAGLAGSGGSADGTGGAARFYYPTGIAIDSSTNIYITDLLNETVRKMDSAGVVTTLAGTAGSQGTVDGTGSAARFRSPFGVATDSSGNVYLTDTNYQVDASNTIRKITAAGVVTTLAGLPGTAGTADGTGSAARFDLPNSLAIDGSGNIYVADTYNSTIRVATPGLNDVATVAAASVVIGTAVQLDTAPQTATSWEWTVFRRPAGSTATLSSTSARNPTFTPDVADLFVFRLTATSAAGSSISTVSLTGRPVTPPGDSNGDGLVTVADVFYTINNLFANGPGPVGSIDVNGDGVSTVADIFYLINYLFANGPAPLSATPARSMSATQPARFQAATPALRIGHSVGVSGGMLTVPVVLQNGGEVDGLSFQVRYSPTAIRKITVRPTGALTRVSPLLEATPFTDTSVSYFVAYGARVQAGSETVVAEIEIELADDIATDGPITLALDRDTTALARRDGTFMASSGNLTLQDGVVQLVRRRDPGQKPKG